MPVQSSVINACDAVVRLADPTGELVDISAHSNEVSIDLSNTIGEWKPFGQKWKRRLDCGKEGSISYKGFYAHNEPGSAVELFKEWFFRNRGTRAVEIMIPDNSPGADKYSCDAVLETFNIPIKSDDANPIIFSADLKPDGEIFWDLVEEDEF